MTVNTNGPRESEGYGNLAAWETLEKFGGIAPESSYYPDIPPGMRPEDIMVLENYVGEMAEYHGWEDDE